MNVNNNTFNANNLNNTFSEKNERDENIHFYISKEANNSNIKEYSDFKALIKSKQ